MIRWILALWIAATGFSATAQEWTDTRVGTYDFVCESLPAGSSTSSVGTFVSGHQRFSIAARACAAAAKANPSFTYQVRPATYRIALVATPASPQTPPNPTPGLALGLDPACAAIPVLDVHIGAAFASQQLTTCYTGTEASTAKFEMFPLYLDLVSQPLPSGWSIDAVTGVISNPGVGPAGGGTFVIRRTTASGVVISFSRNWSIQ